MKSEFTSPVGRGNLMSKMKSGFTSPCGRGQNTWRVYESIVFLVRVNFELSPKKWTKITFHKVYYQNLCISSIYILFYEICFCFVLDLHFFFSFLLARKKRKRSNQEKEKSRAFFCATIIVAIKRQRLAFIIFIKFALRANFVKEWNSSKWGQ